MIGKVLPHSCVEQLRKIVKNLTAPFCFGVVRTPGRRNDGYTSMSVFWKVPFVKRIKLLLTGNLETSFLTSSVPSLRVDV